MNNNTNNNNIIIITFKFKKLTEKISNFNIYKVCNKFLIIFMNPKSTLRYENLSLYSLLLKEKKKRPRSQNSTRNENIDIKGK